MGPPNWPNFRWDCAPHPAVPPEVVEDLPPNDDVYGWDYPRQRDYLYAHGIPSLLIREDASRGLSGDTNAQLQGFMEQIRRSRNASRL